MECIDDYKYKDTELFPSIFAEIMIQLYEGKTFTRYEVIENVKTYHLQHGGVCNKRSYTPCFKKASADIIKQSKYSLQNVAYGTWRLSKFSEEDTYVTKEIGEGNQTVYVYYYPVYKSMALLKGESKWCCKVGMTTRDLWDRIYSQAGTSFPEEPYVALIIKCTDARYVETALHRMLKASNQHISTAPGKEWFMTSPEEIEELYERHLEKHPDDS